MIIYRPIYLSIYLFINLTNVQSICLFVCLLSSVDSCLYTVTVYFRSFRYSTTCKVVSHRCLNIFNFAGVWKTYALVLGNLILFRGWSFASFHRRCVHLSLHRSQKEKQKTIDQKNSRPTSTGGRGWWKFKPRTARWVMNEANQLDWNQARRAGKFFTTATQNWCPDKFSVPTEA